MLETIYFLLTFMFFLFFTIIWSRKNTLDLIFKIVFALFTIYGGLLTAKALGVVLIV